MEKNETKETKKDEKYYGLSESEQSATMWRHAADLWLAASSLSSSAAQLAREAASLWEAGIDGRGDAEDSIEADINTGRTARNAFEAAQQANAATARALDFDGVDIEDMD